MYLSSLLQFYAQRLPGGNFSAASISLVENVLKLVMLSLRIKEGFLVTSIQFFEKVLVICVNSLIEFNSEPISSWRDY